MRLLSKKLFALGTGTLTILVAAACADSTSEAAPPGPDGSTSLPPGPDSAAPEQDASKDARPDAPPRTCSDDGFCHTVLPDNQTLQAVWADGAGVAWAGTKYGKILRFDGTEWKIHTSDLGEISSIWGSSPTEIWVAGAKGIYRGTGATSSAVTFTNTPLQAGAEVHIQSVWGSAANDVWAVGARTDGVTPAGRVYHFTGGTTGGGTPMPVWALDPLSSVPGITMYRRVWGSAGTGVWIVQTKPWGEWGALQESIVRRPSASTKFEDVALPPPDPGTPDLELGRIVGGALESDTSIWVAVSNIYSRRAYCHGVSAGVGSKFTWTSIPYESNEDLDYNVLAASSTGVWAAGNYGRIGKWDGKTFVQATTEVKPLPVIEPFFDLWTATGDELWAVGKGIALHRAKK